MPNSSTLTVITVQIIRLTHLSVDNVVVDHGVVGEDCHQCPHELQKNSRYACSWEREGALIRVALIVVQSMMSVNFKGIMS